MMHEEAITAAKEAAEKLTYERVRDHGDGTMTVRYVPIPEGAIRAAIAAFLAHVEVSEGMAAASDNALQRRRVAVEVHGVPDLILADRAAVSFSAMLAQLAREIAPG